MKKNILTFALMALIPLSVYADTKLSSKTTVNRVFTYKSAAVVELGTAMGKNSGCTYSKSGKYVALRFGQSGSKEMYSALLTASVSGKKVTIGTSGCDNIWSGDGTMNKIYRITLEK